MQFNNVLLSSQTNGKTNQSWKFSEFKLLQPYQVNHTQFRNHILTSAAVAICQKIVTAIYARMK
jgi:hypothetical protein